MPEKNRTVKPGRAANTVIDEDGTLLHIPESWKLLPPGDGPLTKLVKSKGPTWLVQVRKGRRLMSQGVWADGDQIEASRQEIDAKRATPAYGKKRQQDLARRERRHQEYIRDFFEEVVRFLKFHPRYNNIARQLAEEITRHATPIGSGTVARTSRIPIEDRARGAVIAWLRHRATSYETMKIARVKGRRREVRRQLASESLLLLERYRRGDDIAPSCPLQLALAPISHDFFA